MCSPTWHYCNQFGSSTIRSKRDDVLLLTILYSPVTPLFQIFTHLHTLHCHSKSLQHDSWSIQLRATHAMHAFKLMNQANNATIKETVQLKLLESMVMYIGEKPILLPCSSTTALCRSRTGHSPHLQSVPSSAGCDFSKAFLSVQVSIITSTIQCNQNSRVMDHVQMGWGGTQIRAKFCARAQM